MKGEARSPEDRECAVLAERKINCAGQLLQQKARNKKLLDLAAVMLTYHLRHKYKAIKVTT